MGDTAKLIAELRAGLEGVTPGPWRLFVPDRGYCQNLVLTEDPGFAPVKDKQPWKHLVADCDDCNRGEVNAAHIARCSPDNIRAVLDALAAAEAEVEKLTKALALAILATT